MGIRFGPASFGSVKDVEETFEEFHKLGLRACEAAFTYSVYVKSEEVGKKIGELAKKKDIKLSVHAPYWVNLNSAEKSKVEATKKRILDSCEAGEWMGADRVVFHPGFYGSKKEEAYDNIKKGILGMQSKIKGRSWKIKLAPETMGKVNVFGSVEEIGKLVKETGCSFCLDFAHILAREKKLDWAKIRRLFPQKEWHCHFSGIEYGEKGERHHKSTSKEDWMRILKELKGLKKDIVIINESPTLVKDSVNGLRILEEINS